MADTEFSSWTHVVATEICSLSVSAMVMVREFQSNDIHLPYWTSFANSVLDALTIADRVMFPSTGGSDDPFRVYAEPSAQPCVVRLLVLLPCDLRSELIAVSVNAASSAAAAAWAVAVAKDGPRGWIMDCGVVRRVFSLPVDEHEGETLFCVDVFVACLVLSKNKCSLTDSEVSLVCVHATAVHWTVYHDFVNKWLLSLEEQTPSPPIAKYCDTVVLCIVGMETLVPHPEIMVTDLLLRTLWRFASPEDCVRVVENLAFSQWTHPKHWESSFLLVLRLCLTAASSDSNFPIQTSVVLGLVLRAGGESIAARIHQQHDIWKDLNEDERGMVLRRLTSEVMRPVSCPSEVTFLQFYPLEYFMGGSPNGGGADGDDGDDLDREHHRDGDGDGDNEAVDNDFSRASKASRLCLLLNERQPFPLMFNRLRRLFSNLPDTLRSSLANLPEFDEVDKSVYLLLFDAVSAALSFLSTIQPAELIHFPPNTCVALCAAFERISVDDPFDIRVQSVLASWSDAIFARTTSLDTVGDSSYADPLCVLCMHYARAILSRSLFAVSLERQWSEVTNVVEGLSPFSTMAGDDVDVHPDFLRGFMLLHGAAASLGKLPPSGEHASQIRDTVVSSISGSILSSLSTASSFVRSIDGCLSIGRIRVPFDFIRSSPPFAPHVFLAHSSFLFLSDILHRRSLNLVNQNLMSSVVRTIVSGLRTFPSNDTLCFFAPQRLLDMVFQAMAALPPIQIPCGDFIDLLYGSIERMCALFPMKFGAELACLHKYVKDQRAISPADAWLCVQLLLPRIMPESISTPRGTYDQVVDEAIGHRLWILMSSVVLFLEVSDCPMPKHHVWITLARSSRCVPFLFLPGAIAEDPRSVFGRSHYHELVCELIVAGLRDSGILAILNDIPDCEKADVMSEVLQRHSAAASSS
eukprot:ANDGO_05855.mRNA.1 hypothetical protein